MLILKLQRIMKMVDAMGAGLGMLSGACFIWSIIYLCRLIDSVVSGASKGVDEAKEKMNTQRKKFLKKIGWMSSNDKD